MKYKIEKSPSRQPFLTAQWLERMDVDGWEFVTAYAVSLGYASDGVMPLYVFRKSPRFGA